jgi:hypothetical protein
VNGPIEQGSTPAQTEQVLSEEHGAAMLDPDRIASTGTEKGDRAVQSTQENQSVKSSTTSEDNLTVNGPIEQGSIPVGLWARAEHSRWMPCERPTRWQTPPMS